MITGVSISWDCTVSEREVSVKVWGGHSPIFFARKAVSIHRTHLCYTTQHEYVSNDSSSISSNSIRSIILHRTKITGFASTITLIREKRYITERITKSHSMGMSAVCFVRWKL